MFGLSTLATRIAIGLIAAVLLLGALQIRSCQQARQQAAQSKLDRAQGKAFEESAKDAVKTNSDVNANAMASEELTRKNAEDIDNAKGSTDPVDRAVHDAGVRAFCARPSARKLERCRLLQPD